MSDILTLMNGRLNLAEKFTGALFIVMTAWWAVLYFSFGAQLSEQNLYWAASYQIIAWWGGIYGLMSSRAWGGFKSLMGKGILFFSIGLLFQGFGQSVFSYYTTILGVDIPYPSIADIGYFGSIIFYVLGIASMAKVAGAGVRLRNLGGKALALFIPMGMLIFSYAFFFPTIHSIGLRRYGFSLISGIRLRDIVCFVSSARIHIVQEYPLVAL